MIFVFSFSPVIQVRKKLQGYNLTVWKFHAAGTDKATVTPPRGLQRSKYGPGTGGFG